MKKFLSVVLAVLMCVLPLTANVPAAELMGNADATITFSSEAGECGDEIEVKVYLTTTKTFNTFGLRYISYDDDYLTFDGCVVDPAFTSMLTKFDDTKMILSTSLNAPMAGCENALVCTLKFTINNDAPIDTTTVTATEGVLKNTATDYTTEIVDSTVTVKGLDFPEIIFEDKEVEYNGENHRFSLKVMGQDGLPEGSVIVYRLAESGEYFVGAEDAGTYEVEVTVTAPGYNKFQDTATLTINKKDLVIDANIPDKVYDGTTTIENFADYVTLEGVVDGDDVKIDYSNFELSYFAAHVGTWTLAGNIAVRGADLLNYNRIDAWKEATAKITPKPITVKADDITVKAGAEMPTLTYTAEGLVEGDTLLGITLTTTAKNTNTVKDYPITVKANTNYDKNYKITTVNGTLSVIDKTAQEVNVPEVEGTITYGDEGFNLGVTLGEVVNDSAVEYESLTPAVATVDAQGNVTIVGAGTAKIAVSKAGDAEYADFSDTVTFTVNKKNVTVTADNKTATKGGELPEFTCTIVGLVGDDTIEATYTTTAKNTNTVKDYPITVKVTVKNYPNYNITLVPGTLSVVDKTKQEITVTSNAPSSITYGDEGFKIDVAYGNQNVSDAATEIKSDNEDVATVDAQGNVTIVGAGTAKITVSKAGDDVLADFEETIEVVVAKREITVNANAASKKVGNADPELGYSFVGELVAGDAFTGNVAREAGEDVGEYDIEIGTLALNDNYKITFNGAIFTIFDKTPQDITVEEVEGKTYGDEAFDIVVNYGTTNVSDNTTTFASDNEDVATVNANGKVTIVGAGTAKITVARKGNEDLADFSKDVTVVVAKREIKVIANAREKYVGQDTPKLTYTYEGELVGSDEFTGALTVSDGNKAGKTYDIKIGTLSLGDNYKITFEGAKLSVLAKVDQEVVEKVVIETEYGHPDHEIKLVEDTSKYNTNATKYFTSSKESVATVSRWGEVTVVGAGQTKITVSVAGNYKFNDYTYSYTLTVKKKPITITAHDASKKVGADDPELTYTLTGKLVGNDTLTGNVAREAGEEVGEYIIGPGSLSLTNSESYDVNFIGAKFTIFDKTPQDITVEEVEGKTYGDEAFNIVVNYGTTNVSDNTTTFASNNENVATVDADGKVTIVGAGTAKITVARKGNEDLADFSKDVTVVVAKREINVIAEAKEKYVGQETPKLTYTYEGQLVGADVFTGELTVNDKNVAGKSYDIKIGTLALNDNYKVTFTGAKLSVLAKVEQQISVSDVDTFTYGADTGFTVEIAYDGEYNTDSAITFESSDENVLTVDAEGNVTILGAGDARIKVAFEGNYKFYAFEETVFVTVDKADLDFVIYDQIKKIGTQDPEFTYSYTGLVAGDEILGTPERKAGEELGSYDIKPGTLTVSCPENYNIGYTWGKLTIVDKNPQVVEVTGVPENAIYGDDGFDIVAVSESISDTAVEYASSDENVIAVDENGKATIVGAGEAVITVKFAGNDDFAEAEVPNTVVVAAKEIAIDTLDAENKTVTFTGVLDADAQAVSVDFNKLTFTPEDVEEGQTPENYVVTGLTLTGDKSANYTLTTESVLVPMSDEIELVTVTVVAENGTVEGAGSYLAGSEVTLKATANSSYKFSAWYVGEEKVSSDAEYTFTAESDIELTAKFSKKSTGGSFGGGGGTPTRTVYFKANAENTAAVIVDKGDKVQKPEDPTLEGYTFGGWFADEELTQAFDFDKAVDTSITLYAKWVAVETEPDDGEDKPDDGEGKTDEWKNPYVDVKEGDWFYDVVKAATQAGIMNGVSENTFAPNANVTRAMLVTMLYRADEMPETAGDSKFEDVSEGSYYADAVAWAAENGIVLGVSETEFAPDANVTREQIATIIFRYAAYKGVEAIELSENLFFDDADKISGYAVAPMNWLVGKEIITGYEDGTVRPQGSATRAEVAAITARILEYLAQ